MLRNRIPLFVAVLGCCAATVLLAATPLDWPREKTLADGTRVTLFQPQIDSWELYAKIEFHLAAVFSLPDGGPMVPGVLRLTADTTADFETRTVVAYNMKVAETAFPSADPAMTARLTSAAESLIPERPLELLLDRVLAHFEAGSEQPAPAHEKGQGQSALRNDAPVIIASLSPAVLVLFDGEPLWAPIEGTGLEFALNTNWQVFRNEDASRHFLLNEHSWLEADGPSAPARVPVPWTSCSATGRCATAETRARATTTPGAVVAADVMAAAAVADAAAADADNLRRLFAKHCSRQSWGISL